VFVHFCRLSNEGRNGIVTCSALKVHYRKLLVYGVWQCPTTVSAGTDSPTTAGQRYDASVLSEESNVTVNVTGVTGGTGPGVTRDTGVTGMVDEVSDSQLNNNCLNGLDMHQLITDSEKTVNTIQLNEESCCNTAAPSAESNNNTSLRATTGDDTLLSPTGGDIGSYTERNDSGILSQINVSADSRSAHINLSPSNSTRSYDSNGVCGFNSNGRHSNGAHSNGAHSNGAHSNRETLVYQLSDKTSEHSNINAAAVCNDNNSIDPAVPVGSSRAVQFIEGEGGRVGAEDVLFVYLKGSCDVIATRMSQRSGHFMPICLLQSQMETLEEPSQDEHSLTVDISCSVEEIGRQVKEYMYSSK